MSATAGKKPLTALFQTLETGVPYTLLRPLLLGSAIRPLYSDPLGMGPMRTGLLSSFSVRYVAVLQIS